MSVLRLALWQCISGWLDEAAFCEELDAVLAATNAHLVITPELCWPGYGNEHRTKASAVPCDGSLIAQVRDSAARHGCAIILGYAEADGGMLYNSAICIDSNGTVVQNYRKRVYANDYERACFGSGETSQVSMLAGVATAILICKDAEFPELVRHAALEGAALVVVPTALGHRWRKVAETLIPARAFENNVFVAYCNYASANVDPQFCGLSIVAGPDGEAVAQVGEDACLLETTIDLDSVAIQRDRHRFLEELRQLNLSADAALGSKRKLGT